MKGHQENPKKQTLVSDVLYSFINQSSIFFKSLMSLSAHKYLRQKTKGYILLCLHWRSHFVCSGFLFCLKKVRDGQANMQNPLPLLHSSDANSSQSWARVEQDPGLHPCLPTRWQGSNDLSHHCFVGSTFTKN